MFGHRYFTKQEADDLKKIDIYFLKRQGLLEGWREGVIQWKINGAEVLRVGIQISTYDVEDVRFINLLYEITERNGKKLDCSHSHPITTTPCNFGGVRYWFVCKFCNRRVGTLYLGKKYFKCRHCLKLTYRLQNINVRGKKYSMVSALKNAQKIKNLRVKYYKGNPTKRYQGLLNRKAAIEKSKRIRSTRERCTGGGIPYYASL